MHLTQVLNVRFTIYRFRVCEVLSILPNAASESCWFSCLHFLPVFIKQTRTYTRIKTHLHYVLIMQLSYRFDSVSNAHDQFPFFLHLIHKLHRDNPTVKGFAEHFSCSIQRSTKPVTLGSIHKENYSKELHKQRYKTSTGLSSPSSTSVSVAIMKLKLGWAPGTKCFITQ